MRKVEQSKQYLLDHFLHKNYHKCLVGGFNPFETCSSNWIISPGIGVKIKMLADCCAPQNGFSHLFLVVVFFLGVGSVVVKECSGCRFTWNSGPTCCWIKSSMPNHRVLTCILDIFGGIVIDTPVEK